MLKTYFHNNKSIGESKSQKNITIVKYTDQKRIVDINKLLNRVRIEKKNENKKKIIFYCSVVLIIGFFIKLLIIS